LCFRKSLITRGQNTNNISEAGMKIVKDVILQRIKVYSPVQLFYFIINDLDAFYEMKLLDTAANRPPQYLRNKYSLTKAQKKYLRYKPVDINSMLFDVTNIQHNTEYLVDLDLGICTCLRGDTGFPCKHQLFIAQKLNIDLSICLPMTEDMKKKLHTLASGNSDIASGWYGSATDMNYCEYKKSTDLDENCTQAGTSNKINQKMDFKINIEQIDDYEEVMNSFNKTIEDMKKKFDTDKTYFLPAIKSFVNSYQKNVKTHTSLTSAMETFGKYSGLRHTSKKPKLIGNKEIGTQPTARSRRITQIGGRKTLIARADVLNGKM
jgi:hypothetical protein